jgi:hypothetical protein
MTAWDRDTPWRQGHILPDDAVKALQLPADTVTDSVAIVVSHDCDLAQDPTVEPVVEIIVGHWIPTADGNFTYAKNARRLHLTFSGGIQSSKPATLRSRTRMDPRPRCPARGN